MSERPHHLLYRQQPDLSAAAHAVQPVGRAAYRHYADHAAPVLFQVVQHVIAVVLELHHRMLGVEHHQRQQRQHVFGKRAAARLLLPRGQILGAQYAHAVIGQFAPQRVVACRPAHIQLRHFVADAVQLFCCGKIGLILFLVGIGKVFVEQAAHPHHEKLVQVGAEYGQKPAPFEQRIGRILRLIQHPPVEQQPAVFPVNVYTLDKPLARLVLVRTRLAALFVPFAHTGTSRRQTLPAAVFSVSGVPGT